MAKWMMYFCPNCGSSFSNVATDKQLYCEGCHTALIPMNIDRDAYRSLSDTQKRQMKQAILDEKNAAERQEHQHEDYSLDQTGLYEYDVVTILNKGHGQIDRDKMMMILNDHAQRGWRLHTIYSNELGKNAISALGLGINSTACEDVLVFERKLKR